MKDKKHHKFRDHSQYTGEYRGTAHSLCNLKHSVPNKVPIVFDNGSNYDYYFIIKELTIYLFRRKYWKMNNLYRSNRKRSYKNW